MPGMTKQEASDEMSDQSDVPATEPEEAAQDAATQEATSESPPWGDDFDAERAWKTIQNLRQFEKQAKEFERIQSDEDARDEWVRKHYSVVDDTDDSDEEGVEFEEDDDPVAPLRSDLEEIKAWKQQQDAAREDAAIRADIDAINDGSDWDLDDHDRNVIWAWAASGKKQFTRADLEKAHKDYIDRLDGLATKAIERAKKPKPKPSHVTAAGKAATDIKNIVDMTPDEHRAWARERFRERAQGGQST